MKTRISIFTIGLLLGFVLEALFWAPTALSADKVDHGLYADLLKAYVKNGVVDYKGFKKEEAKLDQYLSILEKTDTKALSRNEQFAFYINAYNAWTIKLILSAYPGLNSIKDLGSLFKSPWKKEIARIDGNVITLDNIEHDILRPRFKDPRIHFAVNCASKGCPPLRSEPYRGEMLNEQLNDMTKSFVNDPKYNRLEGKILYVSSIFKWYSEDFNDDILGFFLQYAEGDLKQGLERNREEIKVKHLDYGWSLNGQ